MASVLRGSGDSSFGGNLSIEGVLTYEDVTSVDSVGVITARSGIVIDTQSTSVNPLSVGSKGGGTNDGHLEGEGPKINFLATRSTDGAVGGAAYIQQKAIGDLSSSYPVDLAFGVRRFGSSFEAMRILSTGDIGIGVTNPTSFGPTLQVAGTDPALLLQDTATAVDYFGVNVTSGITQLWYDDAAALTINTASGISGSGLVERLRIDSNNTIHIGKRDGNQNSVHFGTSRVSICGPDPIPTSVSKAGSYLAIGNNESELNGVYPITFGYTNNTNSHQPAYIAYKTTNAGGAEKGDLLFGTRDVTTDTEPTERLRITSGGIVNVKSSAESLRLEPATTADTSYMGFRSNTSHYGFLGAANQLITSGAATDLALRAQGNLILSVSTTPILKVQSSQVIAFKSSIVESGSSLGNAAGSGVELFNLGATNRAYIARGFVVGYGSNADISFEITGVTGGTVTVLHTTTISGSGSSLSFSSAGNSVTVQNGVYNANVYLTMLEYMPNDVTS